MSTSSVSRFKRKNAAGSRFDKGWNHGIDVDGNSRKVKCKYCLKTFTGGIYRFKHHLACTHANVEACVSVPDVVRKEFLGIVSRSTEFSKKKQKSLKDEEEHDSLSMGSSNKQMTINQMMKKDLREEVCQQIARFFYTSGIPLNCVKNPEFTKMFELVGRYGCGFRPPSYHEIKGKYLKKEVARMTTLLEEYRFFWKRTGCSIICDGWSNKKRGSIATFFVNSPKGTVFISSLDTSSVSNIAEVVCKMLDDIIEKVGEKNVVQVVTDNSTDYKAAVELLMQKRKTLYWTPCVAHCVDLILEDLEKKLVVHSETMSKAKKITAYIYGRRILISILRHFTKEKDLVSPAMTRSVTAYFTLDCLNEHRGALMSMFTSDAWKSSRYAATTEGKKVEQFVLDGEFWENMSICLKAACPLIEVLRLVDSDENPAMGFIYKAMDRAKQKIRDNFNNVKRSYEPIWNIINERWELHMYMPLHAAAYYLNPRFCYRSDFKVDANMKIGLYKCLERMVSDPQERNKIDSQLEHFKSAKGLLGIDMAIWARETKLPHQWWDSYGDECPQLQKFAIRILSLTCNSYVSERNWNALEMVHAKKRNHLHQKKVNDLVFVMYNLKLKDRETRKNNDPASFENLDSDDEWITEDYEMDDSAHRHPLFLLDETGKETEDEEDVMAIVAKNST